MTIPAETQASNSFGSNGGDGATSTMKGGAKTLLERGSERASELKDAVVQRGRNTVHAVQGSIEVRPFTYMAGAFVGGVLVGILWMRRRT